MNNSSPVKTNAKLKRIAVLDPRLANQIAAGEVIERPHSVVKEILENSLDAGATHLDIAIEQGGSELVRVRDNGYGIAKDDLVLALRRHATSKISTLDDLFQVQSLGFRGEALASISSVARVTLTSRVHDESAAWQISVEGDEVGDFAGSLAEKLLPTPTAHPYGTTIEVRDLFFNVPARRKFLRTVPTEFTHILEMVRRLALARFDVSMRLQHNSKAVLNFAAAQSEQDEITRVAAICGEDFAAQAIALNSRAPATTIAAATALNPITGDAAAAMKLKGWIGRPTFTRSQQDMQYFYVNGRIVRDKNLAHAVRYAYQDVMPRAATSGGGQRYPALVLYLEIDPQLVDVNVHPTKSEVRFRDSRMVHDFVAHAIKKVLARGTIVTAATTTAATAAANASNAVAGTPNFHVAAREADYIIDRYVRENMRINTSTNENINIEKNTQQNINQAVHAADHVDTSIVENALNFENAADNQSEKGNENNAIDVDANNILDVKNKLSANDLSDFSANKFDKSLDKSAECAPSSASSLNSLGYAIAQLHGTYILAQNEQGLIIVDAHAAHERITYEQLKTTFWQQATIARQELLHPISFSVTPREAEYLEIYSEIFQQLGLNIVRSSDIEFMVRSLPALLQIQNVDIEKLVRDIVADFIAAGASFSLEKSINEILASIACHSSVRAGRNLSMMEMNALLRRIEQTEYGGHCSHGRPTWVQITRAELQKMFKRR